ncbi:hypothetical protein [Nonlabens sp.]|uniref:hypothetical protein n=1 Tax=Nonlabens sp. TaxID=1888209 RepID=UPI001BCCD539|nr:hypothetical protein [Nonlabens sp.]
MKYILITLILLFNCKDKNESDLTIYAQSQNKINFYDLIFNELEKVDIDMFYISYDIDKNFVLTDDIKSSITLIGLIDANKIKNLSSNQLNLNYSKELSVKNLKIISNSKISKSSKTKIVYTFSEPYQIDNNTILIFNRIEFKNKNSELSKGGSERVFKFMKNKNEWEIMSVDNLIDL